MRRLGRVLDEIKPDALIVVGLDHLEAFSLDVSPAFAVVVGPEVVGSFGSKQYRVGVHQTLARALLDGCLKRDFDIAFCHKALWATPSSCPLNTFSRSGTFLSCRSSLMSMCRRCHSPIEPTQLGRAIAGDCRRAREPDSDSRQWGYVPLPRDREVRLSGL